MNLGPIPRWWERVNYPQPEPTESEMRDYETDAASYRIKQQDYLQWTASGFFEGDLELIPLILEVNKIPDIQTIFGCASHPERQVFGFYLCFVVGPTGGNTLVELYKSLKTRIEPTAELTLELGELMHQDRSGFYNVMSFHHNLKSPKTKRLFLQAFLDTVKEYQRTTRGINNEPTISKQSR